MHWQRCCPPSRTCTPGKSSTRTSSRRTCCSKGGRRGVLEGGAFCSPTSVNQCWRIRRAAASRPWRRWRPLNVRHRLVSINPLPNQCHNMPQPLARSNIPIRHPDCVGSVDNQCVLPRCGHRSRRQSMRTPTGPRASAHWQLVATHRLSIPPSTGELHGKFLALFDSNFPRVMRLAALSGSNFQQRGFALAK